VNRTLRAEYEVALERLRRDAAFLAERFKLPLRALDAEGPRVKRRYGICYEDGSIRVRLHNLRSGELLKYSALVDTLCHELAHLKYFDHGVRFQGFYRRMLEYARRQGIYKPSRRVQEAPQRRPPELLRRAEEPPAALLGATPRPLRPSGAVQLELFPPGGGSV